MGKRSRKQVEEQLRQLDASQWRQRWREDLEKLFADVTTVFLNRTVFIALRGSLVAVGGHSVVEDYLVRTYVHGQAMAIRRLNDRNPCTRSLRAVLMDMQRNCSHLTRDDFIANARPTRAVVKSQAADIERIDRESLSEAFDRIAGVEAEADHIPRSVPAEAIKALDRVTKVSKFATQHIAHANRAPDAPVVTFGELDAAIDDLERHLNDVSLILSGPAYELSGLRIHGDWFTPFAGDDRARHDST